MAAPKRTKAQREYDLKEIAGFYLQGWFQYDIVNYIAKNRPYSITRQIVARDLKTIQKHWLESSLVDFNEARAKELAKLDNLELVAWESWTLSKEPEIRKKTAKVVDGKTTEATQEVGQRDGDTKFLDIVLRCIDRRVKLLGLDAPTKAEHTGKDGEPILFTISDFSKAEIELKKWEDDRKPDSAT